MNDSLQTWLALGVVFLTASIFVRRWWVQRGKKGCGGGCGCPKKPI